MNEIIKKLDNFEMLALKGMGGKGGVGTEITDGIVVKARDADGYATEVELYSADGIAYPYMFYNGYKASSWNYEQVTWKSCKLLTIKSQLTSIKKSAFTAFPGDISHKL